MGKEHELLEAARAGNLPLVERILSQRAKLTGPLASLRRGPGANVQDSSGYTPLHHAALNGHKDIVQLLLSYDASPNILDTKGSSPLHLAAWAGHTGIVKLLLTHGPALTNVNLTTRDNESALHCAAQYGHTAVVGMLLQHGADPTVRSVRDETALDLASQYGRLETVELLVRTHPELLEPYRQPRGTFTHTPLHRASKNGHKAVVVVLLKAGHSVNACTSAGAALHEAALCGKLNVVKALLARGADPRVRDRAGDTVIDALARFPPHVTHDIVNLIHQYNLSNGYDSDHEDLPKIPLHQHDGPHSPYDNVMASSNSNNNSGRHHIWERRDDDERRVSGTSGISMMKTNSITDSPALDTRRNAVMVEAKRTVDVDKDDTKKNKKMECEEGDKANRSDDSSSSSSKSNNNNNTSTLHIGKSRFFGRKKAVSEEQLATKHEKVKVKTKKKKKSTKKDDNNGKQKPRKGTLLTTSLPDILEMSEKSSERSDSFRSIVSISNSLYIDSREGVNRDEALYSECGEEQWNPSITPTFDDDDVPEQTRNVVPVHRISASFEEVKFNFADGHESHTFPKPRTKTEHDSNTIPRRNLSAKHEIAKPALRLSHSIRTLRNWTSENTNFKNAEPLYALEAFPGGGRTAAEAVNNNLYYAHLDFDGSAALAAKKLKDTDYELFDFKTGTIVEQQAKRDDDDDNEDEKIFKPIQVFRGSSTVFIDTDSLVAQKPRQLYKDTQPPPIMIESKRKKSSSSMDKFSYYRSVSLAKNYMLMDALPSNRTSMDSTSTALSYTDEDLASLCGSWKPSGSRREPNATTPDVGDIVYMNYRRPDFREFEERRSSVQSSESDYLPMGGVLLFSKDRASLDGGGGIGVTTLRQLRAITADDPPYENLVLAREVQHHDIRSPVSEKPPPKFHAKGTGDCIYDKSLPTENEYIYILNRRSVMNTGTAPFFKVSRQNDELRNVCFCDGKRCRDDSKDAKCKSTAKSGNFTCYCQKDGCKYHHTKSSKVYVVRYTPLTHSVSFPNLSFSRDNNNKDKDDDVYVCAPFSPSYINKSHSSSSAFVLCNSNKNNRVGDSPRGSSSSLSFHSLASDDISYVQLDGDNLPKRSSAIAADDESIHYENLSNFSTLNGGGGGGNASATSVAGGSVDVNVSSISSSSLCRPALDGGGRSLCVRSGSAADYPYSKSSDGRMDGSYHSEELSSGYHHHHHHQQQHHPSGRSREPDQLSISSTTSSTGGPSPRERQRSGTNDSSMYMNMGPTSGYHHHAHSPGSNTKVSPTPPKKPPRRILSVSPTHLLPPGGIPDGSSERHHYHLSRTGQTRSQDDLDDLGPASKHSGLRHGRSVDQCVSVDTTTTAKAAAAASPRTKPVPQPRPSLAVLAAASRREQPPVAISTMYENVVIKEQNPRRKLRRNNPTGGGDDARKHHRSSQERSSMESLLDDSSSSQQTPLSPTHYDQPPTPDHPPPSAKQAEMSIHERIRPLSQVSM